MTRKRPDSRSVIGDSTPTSSRLVEVDGLHIRVTETCVKHTEGTRYEVEMVVVHRIKRSPFLREIPLKERAAFDAASHEEAEALVARALPAFAATVNLRRRRGER